MATINSLPQATALESTDKFLIETLTVPKSISGAVLKESVTSGLQQKDKVIWENESGTSGSFSATLEVGKTYRFYFNSHIITETPTVPPYYYKRSQQVITVKYASVFAFFGIFLIDNTDVDNPLFKEVLLRQGIVETDMDIACFKITEVEE